MAECPRAPVVGRSTFGERARASEPALSVSVSGQFSLSLSLRWHVLVEASSMLDWEGPLERARLDKACTRGQRDGVKGAEEWVSFFFPRRRLLGRMPCTDARAHLAPPSRPSDRRGRHKPKRDLPVCSVLLSDVKVGGPFYAATSTSYYDSSGLSDVLLSSHRQQALRGQARAVLSSVPKRNGSCVGRTRDPCCSERRQVESQSGRRPIAFRPG
jgi:hypothetical protein